jgi:HPt (histidine-containing phosphotransfer) domain-containing protein
MFTANPCCDTAPESAGPIYSALAIDPDMAELVALFVAELPSRVDAIRQAATPNDWNEVRLLAHQLKGAGGSYGFPQITAAAAELERACGQQPASSDAASALGQFAAVCGRARAGVPEAVVRI